MRPLLPLVLLSLICCSTFVVALLDFPAHRLAQLDVLEPEQVQDDGTTIPSSTKKLGSQRASISLLDVVTYEEAATVAVPATKLAEGDSEVATVVPALYRNAVVMDLSEATVEAIKNLAITHAAGAIIIVVPDG